VKLTEYYDIIQQSCPKLHFCERFHETDELWNHARHSHPYIELMYFMDGKGRLEVSGQQLSISLFDTIVYPAGWSHSEEDSPEKQREVICLWVELPELKLQEPIQLHDRNNQIGTLFRMIHEESKNPNAIPQLQEYGIKALLTILLRDRSESPLQEEFLTCVLQYIHNHFAEKITLDDLAALEHISISYLCRQFKRQTGMTVITYINNLRIDTAKRLLLSTNFSVNEIAYQVGFESPKYFYRAFKSVVGDSPAAFCREYRK